jgi:hypothetical protein
LAGDHHIDLGCEHRAGHAERPEDALGQHLAQLLAFQLLDDQPE